MKVVMANPSSQHIVSVPSVMTPKLAADDVLVSIHPLLSEDPPMGVRVIASAPMVVGTGSSTTAVLRHVGDDVALEDTLWVWKKRDPSWFLRSRGFDDPYRFVVVALMEASACYGTQQYLDVMECIR